MPARAWQPGREGAHLTKVGNGRYTVGFWDGRCAAGCVGLGAQHNGMDSLKVMETPEDGGKYAPGADFARTPMVLPHESTHAVRR